MEDMDQNEESKELMPHTKRMREDEERGEERQREGKIWSKDDLKFSHRRSFSHNLVPVRRVGSVVHKYK